ncbi:MAG: colicin import membrane protein [Candidatus Marivariicella framensis]|jgi:colicin import membrane protein|tara:strand:- start:380 stop:1222 length:843 start_codon:yes stop_codon:yes gene_type:complete
MEFLKTRHEQKSFLITIFMVILLLFLFSFIGLKYIDPPIEYGMEVNLGSNYTGKGLKSANEEVLDPKTDKLNTSKEDINLEKPEISKTTPSKVATQKNSNSEVVDKPSKDSLITINKKNEPRLVQKNNEVKKPKVSDVTKSIISNLMNIESKSERTQGEGETEGLSDQGKSKGDPYSTMYYGQEGRGGQGVGYGLSGRSLQVNGKETQDCNESGTVVVRIVVNKLGEVVSAKPGVKGTTNNDPCLLKPAQNTALMHRWFPDANAPEKQIGFVVIEFKLVE